MGDQYAVGRSRLERFWVKHVFDPTYHWVGFNAYRPRLPSRILQSVLWAVVRWVDHLFAPELY